MSFSIVIVTLDAANDLPLTLESIVQQTFDDHEIILVDGFSVDSTAEVASRYTNHIKKFIRVEDSGIYDAMNRSLEHCSKDYVIFMNAKDRFFSANVLEKIWSRKIGDPDIMFGDHVYVDAGRDRLQRSQKFEFIWQSLEAGDISARWHESIPCHQATFTKASLLRRNRYDVRLEVCADHEFMFRVFSQGCVFQYIDETVCHYFGGGLSAKRAARLKFELVQTYRKFCNKPHNVDIYFLGANNRIFGASSAKTGVSLFGLSEEKPGSDSSGAPKVRWCYGKDTVLISPDDLVTESCRIIGLNPFGSQELEIRHDGVVIAKVGIPHGKFAINVALNRPLLPKSEIILIAQYSAAIEAANGEMVSIGIREIIFDGRRIREASKLDPGAVILFGHRCSANLGSYLVNGWSEPEESHVWSIESEAFLFVKTGRSAIKVELEIGGNPYIPSTERRLQISVNDVALLVTALPADRRTFSIDCANSPWLVERPNLIALKTDVLARPPKDSRTLGICLHRLCVS